MRRGSDVPPLLPGGRKSQNHMGETKSTAPIPPLIALMHFAKSVSKNKAFEPQEPIATPDPKGLFAKWRAAVKHKHGDKVECRVQYLPDFGEHIEACKFFAFNMVDGEAWQSVDVAVTTKNKPEAVVSEEIATPRHYKGLRGLLNI